MEQVLLYWNKYFHKENFNLFGSNSGQSMKVSCNSEKNENYKEIEREFGNIIIIIIIIYQQRLVS